MKKTTTTKPMAKTTTDETDIFQLLEEIEKRKQPAIDALLKEREAIDAKLSLLGYSNGPVKRETAQGEKQKRAPKTCSICKKQGHTSRTCPTAKADATTA